jgi:hypothetical protein
MHNCLYSDAIRTPVRVQPRVGPSLASEPNGERGQIEPRGDAEGAGENLGLDDIPRVKMVEWILLAACDERNRGRSLMRGGAEGPRALMAFGKACRRKKRKRCKASVVDSSGTGHGRRDKRESSQFEAHYLVVFVDHALLSNRVR